MPPHHHHRKPYRDCYWSEMPESAQSAAVVLGWTAASWDADAQVPYDTKPFVECTATEKHAALYLGMDPIRKKLDPLWWNEVDEMTQRHAMVLGWDETKWNDDWNLRDLEVEHLYWNELSDEQKKAAQYFGYSQILWDETGEEESDFGGVSGAAAAPSAQAEEEDASEDEGPSVEENLDDSDDDDDDDEKVQEAEAEATTAAVAPTTPSQPGKKRNNNDSKMKNPFKMTRAFGNTDGGGGGEAFDHGRHKHIDRFVVYANRHVVTGLSITYSGGDTRTVGHAGKGQEHAFDFDQQEYITAVTVRSSNKYVQSLKFYTTKGRWLGPVGGKGWLMRGDKKGPEVALRSPGRRVLCGLAGFADGEHLYALKFCWGPRPGGAP